MRQNLRWFLFLLALFTSFTSFAQNDTAAANAFKIANAFYSAKKYQEAIPYYQEAYDLSKKTPILFNIGQCYRLLDNKQKALEFYERFLKETPPGESTEARIQAEVFVSELKTAMKPIETPATTPVDPTPNPQPKPPIVHYVAPAGIAVVGLGVGMTFGAKALQHKEDSASDNIETPDEKSRGKKLALTSDVATFGGLAAAGIVFFVTKPKKDKVSLSVGPNQLVAHVSF